MYLTLQLMLLTLKTVYLHYTLTLDLKTTLIVDNIPSINNKKSTLKLKTTSSDLSVATPLTINIT